MPTDEEAVVQEETIEKLPLPYPLTPFDLMKNHLYRIKIINTKTGHYLFLEIHHLVFDGASLAVLFKDIENA